MLFQIDSLAVTENAFNETWDMNKDGHVSFAELVTVIYTLELL